VADVAERLDRPAGFLLCDCPDAPIRQMRHPYLRKLLSRYTGGHGRGRLRGENRQRNAESALPGNAKADSLYPIGSELRADGGCGAAQRGGFAQPSDSRKGPSWVVLDRSATCGIISYR